MVVIRLSRAGSKKKPFYHVVVTDKRNPRDGRCVERIGFFDPLAQGQTERLRLDLDRINYWTNVGAQPSERVVRLIKDAKAIQAAAPVVTEAA